MVRQSVEMLNNLTRKSEKIFRSRNNGGNLPLLTQQVAKKLCSPRLQQIISKRSATGKGHPECHKPEIQLEMDGNTCSPMKDCIFRKRK
jgi:hypothetical protein